MFLNNFSCREKNNTYKKELEKHGHIIFNDAYSLDFCNSIIHLIDQHENTTNTENNYSGTELRIWSAQKKHTLFNQFFNEGNQIISSIFGKKILANTLLAIRNRSLNPEDLKSRISRWHIDSFSTQYKIFLFLTDTTEESGPFEFIPYTHSKFFKFRMVCRRQYFKFSDFLKNKRNYQHLSEELIWDISHSGYHPNPILCKAGTLVIVNTSSIHRARPCTQGYRYALTSYF